MIRRIAPIALVAALVACAPAPASSVRESSAPVSAIPSATATDVPGSSSQVASPKPSGVFMPGGLAVGRVAEIVTTDLVVRSLPEISDASAMDPITVPIRFLAYIVDGPVAADGYD